MAGSLAVDASALMAVLLEEPDALRFGKGRYPAGLNFGDRFSYALAKLRGEPLLFKGEDFSKTDLVGANLFAPNPSTCRGE